MTDQNYPIIDISCYQRIEMEHLGTKEKFWYEDKNQEAYLFKSIRTQNKKGEPIERFGEDWAEKIASELAEALNIPHATYELAQHQAVRGVITKKFIENDSELVLGNVLINNLNNLNNPTEQQAISRVRGALQEIVKNKPIQSKELENIKTASDFFVGYLMLDVLISNQDRHSENWGMITLNNQNYLAPTFDHAASMGRNESDEGRKEIMNNNPSLEQYVKKAKSYFKYYNQRLNLIDAFLFFAKKHEKATLTWLEQLEQLLPDLIQNKINRVPHSLMSDTAKAFTFTLICTNRKKFYPLKIN